MSLLRMSATGGIMILAVAAVRALLMHRLPKKTLLALWALVLCRLLIPYELPSPMSVYTTAPAAVEAVQETVRDLRGINRITLGTAYLYQPEATNDMTGWISIGNVDGFWLCGAVACALFFLITWVRCRRRFADALPAEESVAEVWKTLYHGKTVRLKVSDRVAAPLTYGIVHPVLLLPKGAAWETEETLRYVLAHEAVHIRRCDALWKLILTIALCIHWFNPLVWVMYLLSNRDLELSCDETVVHSFGEGAKSSYAMTLIGMEAKQSGLLPLTSAFSKTAIEQRVKAIMKLKKTTVFAVVVALAVVVAVGVGFATSAEEPEISQNDQTIHMEPGEARKYPETTAADYELVLSLLTDGYEKQTLSEFNAKLLESMGQTPGLAEAYDRVQEDFSRGESKHPLTEEQWSFLTLTLTASASENAAPAVSEEEFSPVASCKLGYIYNKKTYFIEVEITLSYHIIDPNVMTVKKRDEAFARIQSDLAAWLDGVAVEELFAQDKAAWTQKINRIVSDAPVLGMTFDVVPEDNISYSVVQTGFQE